MNCKIYSKHKEVGAEKLDKVENSEQDEVENRINLGGRISKFDGISINELK